MDKVEPVKKDELVYQIPCKSCGAAYIREIGILHKTRRTQKKIARGERANRTRGVDKDGHSPSPTSPPSQTTQFWVHSTM